ncbi:MAG: hypothetical protein LBN02_07290 [Oscillospiraceae bacterium]|jgi:hypothetical protein|nr:hypothetical protein [Oscillospiraceae bacterium]
MTVNVKFVCKDLTEGLVNGEYDVSDGATVRGVVSECERVCGVTLPPERDKQLQFLLNGKSAQWDYAVPDGAKLHVLRAILGG